mgnify:CR=1 FL=1
MAVASRVRNDNDVMPPRQVRCYLTRLPLTVRLA